MAARRKLVLEHLEDISGRVLEEYPDIIRSMMRGRHGIYALYRRKSLYYVGLASDLMRRLKQHLRDRHAGRWNRFSVYLTHRTEHMKELESLILRIIDPPANRVKGSFADSANLQRALNRAVTASDAEKRARLLGSPRRTRKRKKPEARTGRAPALQGLVPRRMRIRGWRGDWEYYALLRKSGVIVYGDEEFTSPSGAARAALGGARNGWRFWHYRASSGDWAPLDDLR